MCVCVCVCVFVCVCVRCAGTLHKPHMCALQRWRTLNLFYSPKAYALRPTPYTLHPSSLLHSICLQFGIWLVVCFSSLSLCPCPLPPSVSVHTLVLHSLSYTRSCRRASLPSATCTSSFRFVPHPGLWGLGLGVQGLNPKPLNPKLETQNPKPESRLSKPRAPP